MMIINRKCAAGLGILALTVAAVATSQAPSAVKQNRGAETDSRWAFPGPLNKSVPGSKVNYSDVQMYDRTGAVDWFPGSHPSMPAAVKGRLPVYACGFCHLPEGAGRPENAALAGMPYEYLKRQIDDMQSGARVAPDPHFGPAVNMHLTITHKELAKEDAYEAVKYYSGLKYAKHINLIEATEIPHARANAFVYVFDKSGAREPLGERIVEGPDDFERFESRDPNVTLTTYVPVGSIGRGAVLAKGNGGSRASCESCHGLGLKGGAVGPPIAGRPVTPTFRQLRAFEIGTRNGIGAALMKPIVGELSQKDMIDLAAYVGSLEP